MTKGNWAVGVLVGLVGVLDLSVSAAWLSNPTPPYTFPYGVNSAPHQPQGSGTYWKGYGSCSGWLKKVSGPLGGIWTSAAQCDHDGKNCNNFLARPTLRDTDGHFLPDPNWTDYSHGHQYNATDCAAGDLRCQHETDFFSIPSANGFKYNVDRISSIRCALAQSSRAPNPRVQRCTAVSTKLNHYFHFLQRVDKGWSMKPWPYQAGEAAPWTQLINPAGPTPYFDLDAHPSDGADGKTGDWLRLWDLQYTYRKAIAPAIDSQLHQCTMIYVSVTGKEFLDGQPGLKLYDFATAGETYNAIGTWW